MLVFFPRARPEELADRPSSTPPGVCGLRSLDELLRAADRRGVVRVRVTDSGTAAAVQRHLVRRARVLDRRVVVMDVSAVDSCWQDASARLGLLDLPLSPAAFARALAQHASGAVLVLVGDTIPGSWDDEVRREIALCLSGALLVQVSVVDGINSVFEAEDVIYVRGDLPDEAEVWWQGVADQGARRSGPRTLTEFDSWWQAACRTSVSQELPVLAGPAQELLSKLVLARRTWPEAGLASLGDPEALADLVRNGYATLEQGFVVLALGLPTPQADADAMLATARALEDQFRHDPFAIARAGVLHMAVGDEERGEGCLIEAMRQATDISIRRQLWNGWCEALSCHSEEARGAMALRSAELALELDDAEVAARLVQIAGVAANPQAFGSLMVLGRTLMARGDLVAARAWLERAIDTAADGAQVAQARSQLAEACYLAGDLEEAHAHASEVVHGASSAIVRLQARNTLGKLLLARSEWSAAEAHFATDEHDAACAGAETPQLRARINRAIALLSRGCFEPARAILESALAQAERRRDPRAIAFALSNLAVLAVERRDYIHAFAMMERAIEVRRQLGDRIALARVVVNLAETRLRVGLVDEAEQTLAFGRQSLGPGMPSSCDAVMSLVSAWIQFARGNTVDAARQVDTALVDIGGWTDGARLGECHRLLARIALDDGDVERAARYVDEASGTADSKSAEAELCLLKAQLARARGDSATELASQALALAREARDHDLLREVNLLFSHLAYSDKRLDAALRHLRAAEQLRDQVTDSLPEAWRVRYLARREVRALSAAAETLRQAQSVPLRSTPLCADRAANEGTVPSPTFVGGHASVLRLMGLVRKVARSTSPVLILGESGTGKELIAEAIHALSGAGAGPLVKVNCAALVETLLLSELFGHERGAFTGAVGRRRGRFELADGGTLFLDEIGDISPKTQMALLRVLQDRTFERVGGTTPIHTKARIVCATHRDLRALVTQGIFREDLYYRLCGITLEVPPLRKRMDDVDLLSNHLLARIAREHREPGHTLSSQALAALRQHHWPGNVRELDNVLRAASLFAEGDTISEENIREQYRASGYSTPPGSLAAETVGRLGPVGESRDVLGAQDRVAPQLASPIDTSSVAYQELRSQGTSLSDLKKQIERDCIERALIESKGNITRAALLLGMKRPRLSQLVKQYALLPSDSEDN